METSQLTYAVAATLGWNLEVEERNELEGEETVSYRICVTRLHREPYDTHQCAREVVFRFTAEY
jgi:hypothetical protein